MDQCWGFLTMEALHRSGVTHVCIAPGSRSTPLTLAAAQHPDIQTHIHFDERGLGFFALGLAKALETPVAVITTSGTAVANLLPAVVEASQSFVPLIMLSADRPEELLQTGANQAIQQRGIFGDYVRHAVDMPVPTADIQAEWVVSTVEYACFKSQSPTPGPVHLNAHFREPFGLEDMTALPASDPYLHKLKTWLDADQPYTRYSAPELTLSDDDQQALIQTLASWSRGCLIVGECTTRAQWESAARIAEALMWPVIADVSSSLRFSNLTYLCHDCVLSSESLGDEIDGVLHLGTSLTSKALSTWLSGFEGEYIQCVEVPERLDPLHAVRQRYTVSMASLATSICACTWTASHTPHYLSASQGFNTALSTVLSAETVLSEPAVANHLVAALPTSGFIMAGNSMPIRLLNQFVSVPDGHADHTPVFVNRGASGIDGVVATAAGLAEGLQRPGVLFIGDLSTLHDLNSLALLRQLNTPLHVVVLNNDGGGIFTHLPIAKATPHFSDYFKTPHGLTFSAIAEWLGIPYFSASSLDELALDRVFSESGSTLTECVVQDEPTHRVIAKYHAECERIARDSLSPA